jgi:hypothetical protein
MSDLLREIPELLVVDSFEHKVQRPANKEDRERFYSFKKDAHKS